MDFHESQRWLHQVVLYIHVLPFENLFPKHCFRRSWNSPVVARKAPRAAQEPAEAGLTCLLLLLSQITSWDSRAIISRSSISLNTTLSPDPCFFPRSQQEAHWARTAVLTLSVSFLLDSLWGSLCILSAQGEEVLLSELLFCARK